MALIFSQGRRERERRSGAALARRAGALRAAFVAVGLPLGGYCGLCLAPRPLDCTEDGK